MHMEHYYWATSKYL